MYIYEFRVWNSPSAIIIYMYSTTGGRYYISGCLFYEDVFTTSRAERSQERDRQTGKNNGGVSFRRAESFNKHLASRRRRTTARRRHHRHLERRGGTDAEERREERGEGGRGREREGCLIHEMDKLEREKVRSINFFTRLFGYIQHAPRGPLAWTWITTPLHAFGGIFDQGNMVRQHADDCEVYWSLTAVRMSVGPGSSWGAHRFGLFLSFSFFPTFQIFQVKNHFPILLIFFKSSKL